MYQTIRPKMDTTHPDYAHFMEVFNRACQLGDAGDFAGADKAFNEALMLEPLVPTAELTAEEKAVNWWHDELSINQQKAYKAQAGIPYWFPQYSSKADYRSKLLIMHQMQQAAQLAV